MAEEETDSLELVPIEVWNSREALDADVEDPEEGKLRHKCKLCNFACVLLFRRYHFLYIHTILSHAGDGEHENSEGTGRTASDSEADNFTIEETRGLCACYFQPVSQVPCCRTRISALAW